jgi:hypothetical protein
LWAWKYTEITCQIDSKWFHLIAVPDVGHCICSDWQDLESTLENEYKFRRTRITWTILSATFFLTRLIMSSKSRHHEKDMEIKQYSRLIGQDKYRPPLLLRLALFKTGKRDCSACQICVIHSRASMLDYRPESVECLSVIVRNAKFLVEEASRFRLCILNCLMRSQKRRTVLFNKIHLRVDSCENYDSWTS